MRLTAADMWTMFRDSTGNHNSTDAGLQTFYLNSFTGRYQSAFAGINNRQTQKVFTGATVVNQQFYHYPPDLLDLADCTVTINGLAYPVIADDSILQWDRINLVLISVTALPQFIFPRRDDFGIWPIPQGVYPINIYAQLRDRTPTDLVDYNTGTVSCTNNSVIVTGSGTNFTANMVGYWFVMNDTTQPSNGYWYRIQSIQSTTQLTLETYYTGTSVTTAAYRIGQSPELPPETHSSLVEGAIADYKAGPRDDVQAASWHDNMYWTGSGLEKEREGKMFFGGVLGAQQKYAGRQSGAIVWQHGLSTSWTERMWASGITP